MRGQTDKTLLIKDKHSHPKYLAMWEIRSSRYARTYGEEKGKITIFLRDSFFLFTQHFFFFNLFTFTKNFVKIQFLQRKKKIFAHVNLRVGVHLLKDIFFQNIFP